MHYKIIIHSEGDITLQIGQRYVLCNSKLEAVELLLHTINESKLITTSKPKDGPFRIFDDIADLSNESSWEAERELAILLQQATTKQRKLN